MMGEIEMRLVLPDLAEMHISENQMPFLTISSFFWLAIKYNINI